MKFTALYLFEQPIAGLASLLIVFGTVSFSPLASADQFEDQKQQRIATCPHCGKEIVAFKRRIWPAVLQIVIVIALFASLVFFVWFVAE